jgi:hypothetical protein
VQNKPEIKRQHNRQEKTYITEDVNVPEQKAKKMHNSEAGRNLIFILGIMQRSGTNYLNNLLLLHPDCEYPGLVWEDYDYLKEYADSVYHSWSPLWKNKVTEIMGHNPLLNCIGEGLCSFFSRQYESNSRPQLKSTKKGTNREAKSPRIVTATPSVKSLQYFFQLFPCAHLLIVIRDGRAVVESGIKSFNWDFEHSARRWAEAAETIHEFDVYVEQDRYLIVRYEDLYSNNSSEMTNIFSFLGLDIEKYDFDAAANLPVMGSSDLSDDKKKIHWNAGEKSPDFNPIDRWKHWKRPNHERFNWLAGKYQEQFAYSKKKYESRHSLWAVWNMILDRLYKLEVWLKNRNVFLYEPVRKVRNLFFLLPDKFTRRSSDNASVERIVN